MNTVNHPSSVRLSYIAEFIHGFAPDVPIEDVREVVIDSRGVTLVVLRRNESGHRFAAGNEIATVTVTYELDREDA